MQKPTIDAMRMPTASTLKGAIHVAVIMVTKVMVTTAQVSKLDIWSVSDSNSVAREAITFLLFLYQLYHRYLHHHKIDVLQHEHLNFG